MELISFDEKRKISIEILLKIDEICKCYNIQYYLAYGTLLGAVRHNGFIPWDDDIDIWMTDDNYSIFKEKAHLMTGCKLLECQKKCEWPRAFSKVSKVDTIIDSCISPFKYGVSVDIFFLHKCQPQNVKRICRYANKINRMANFLCGDYNGSYKNFILQTMHSCGLTSAFYYKKLNNYINKIKNQQCNFLFAVSPYNERDLHSIDCFDVSYNSFEGYTFPIPKGFDKILTNLYGNYMELPPVEKRIPPHDEQFYKL